MTTTPTTTTATAPLTIGETAATFAPLTPRDLCDFEQWARDEIMAFLAAQPGITPEAISAAAFASIGLAWHSPEVQQIAESQGITYLIWLATRRSHDLTPEQLREQITGEQFHLGVRLLIASGSLENEAGPATHPGDNEPTTNQ